MIDLEERLRRAADLLDDQAMWVHDPAPVARRPIAPTDRRSTVTMRIAAVCILLAGVAGVFWATARRPGPATGNTPSFGDESTQPTTPPTTPTVTPTSPPDATVPPTLGTSSVAPVATLPNLDDLSSGVPPTVSATAPTDWYRLQPDLDVAWYSDDGVSMLCFRTPAGEGCQVDEFAPTTMDGGPIGVISLGDQLLVATIDPSPTVKVPFDNGQTVTSPVERDDQTGWGIARIQMAAGTTPVGLAMVFAADPPDSTIATSVPVTVPVTSAAG